MKKLIIVFSLLVFAIGCSSDSNGSDSGSGTYDRTAMLTNWADNIIIPSYQNYQAKVNDLTNKAAAFTAAPGTETLTALRQSWLAAYKAYQYVGLYDVGKAEELNLITSSNTFPADASGIDANIASSTYNLTLYAQFDKQGFPCLDYLINGLGQDDAAITAFYTGANATGYKQYLTAVVARLKQTADAIVTDWTGGYRATFISSTGTSVTSAVNSTTNNFVKNLEKDVRSPKVAIPIGIFSNGQTFPDKVEAYYKNDVSKELLNDAVHASQDFFDGKYFGSDTKGPSLKGYLDAVNAVRDGQKLSDIIDAQYALIFTSNASLSNSFSDQITTDNSKMITAYNVLQQGVVYIKLDMLQALNITIDYVDGDGD